MCPHLHQKNQPFFKTLTFAIVHVCVAFLVTFAITGSLAIGGLVAIIEPMVNTFVFFLHEKLWNKVDNAKPTKSQISNQSESA